MADEIGKGGDLISREQAMEAVRSEEECDGPIPPELSGIDRTELVRAAVRATKHNIEAAIRALTSIAPDPIEAEISVADEWVKAYPESIFPPLSDDEIAEAGTKLGDAVMSRLHAGWARHIHEWIRRDLAAARAARDAR